MREIQKENEVTRQPGNVLKAQATQTNVTREGCNVIYIP